MKILTLTLLASLFASNVMAGQFEQAMNQTTNLSKQGALYASGTIGAVGIGPFISSASCGETKNPDACFNMVSSSWTTVLTSSTTVLLKEDIKNVEVDAYDYLAGSPKTLALEEVIEKVREVEEDSENLSDEEIVTAMIKSL